MLRVYFVVVSLLVAGGSAQGQAFFPIGQGASTGRFIEPPRSILQQLRLAEEAAQQRRYGDAVVILGDLLQRDRTLADDELSGQDFFIDVTTDAQASPRVSKTLIGEARRLLGSLPSEAIVT